MTEMSEERRLFREAAELAIRFQNDPANPVSVAMVRAWVARSPRHAAAWARVAEIHGMTGKILTEQRKAAEGFQPRRGVLLGLAGFGAVAAAGGSLLLPGMLLDAKADFVTATAEIRRIELPDGSVVTMGPDSAIGVGYTDTSRTVELLKGMSYFEAASDPSRPFSVQAASVTASAVGTAFDVSVDAGFISVSVGQGVVEAKAPDSELAAGERLAAGSWITLDPSTRSVTRGTRETGEIAAWRGRLIVAERETVAAMVAKISRWFPGRVIVADPWLASRVVSGVFDLDDPVRALDAVVRPFGAKVRGIGSMALVISPV